MQGAFEEGGREQQGERGGRRGGKEEKVKGKIARAKTLLFHTSGKLL